MGLTPVAQTCTQAQYRLAVDLAGARLRDPKHLADLAKVELVVVVQGHHQLLTLRQCRGDGALPATFAEFDPLPGDPGGIRLPPKQPFGALTVHTCAEFLGTEHT